MTGRKRESTIEKPVRVDELRPWSELPTELLELIVSCLCIEDNVRFSCVCKKWQYVSHSLCVVNQSPWLLFSPAEDGLIKFFDPSQGKFYFDEIPELKATFILCSKDGWVLFSAFGYGIFLYNPFTQSIIDLPCYIIYQFSTVRVALSCAPTSPDCVVFAVETDTSCFGSQGVSIRICHPGDAQWTTFQYQITDGEPFCCGDCPVFCNGLFYCLNETSDISVGVFDPQKHTLSVLSLPSLNLPRLSCDRWRPKYMAEFKGDLLLVCVSYPDKPIIFKLELSKMKWVEMKSLNGATVFVSTHSSLVVTNVPRISSNSVYFSKPVCYGKSSYLYCLDDCRYHPTRQWCEGQFFQKSVWIRPPKMTHLLFDELY
ncbi:F-box/kelch-repeat protein At1g57790-like isoform X3 [Telopea speciosissima]|uniref:F-box/kelch-repeat protein At1g57790-like isoform X3 n=1 Tax=Telopea speciosissima TaxID=54955 RepID=UPI001CC6F75D|nr:F-box/kelch-repeat protein At1g57790-like isoform X3 [Telopea speciosissima]